MSRTISFRDLKVVPELQGFNEIEMLHPKMDGIIYNILDNIGFDVQYAVQYFAANHRDLKGKVAVGFMATGEININRKHMNAVYTDNMTRLAASSYTDRSLTVELANLSGTVLDFKAFNEAGIEEGGKELYEGLIEENWKEVKAEINMLNGLRDRIRGPLYNAAGSPKTFEEYAEWYATNPLI